MTSLFQPEMGLEPMTCSLRVSCSATELFWHKIRRENQAIEAIEKNQA
jgi:hypothetical protein